MRLKVTYVRDDSAESDVVIDTDLAATIGALAEDLVLSDPDVALTESEVSGRVTLAAAAPDTADYIDLDPGGLLGEASIASGYRVRVVRRQTPSDAPRHGNPLGATVHLTIKSGEQTGRHFSLVAGSHLIGRYQTNDVVLPDPMVSGTHARLVVGPTTELVDLNSANGIVVDGSLVSRLRILPGQQVVLGETTIEFDIDQPRIPDVRADIVGATLPFNRSPRVEQRYPGKEYPSPEVPRELDKPMFAWIMLLAPLAIGAGMFAVTRQATSLIFVVMSPAMMIGNYMTTRRRRRTQGDSAVALFEAQLHELQTSLEAEILVERAVREQEAPRAEDVGHAVQAASPLLWTRRPEHWSFLHLRLGTGRELSRNTVAASRDSAEGLVEYTRKRDETIERFRWIEDVPIVESPQLAGAIGVVGNSAEAFDAARALIMQLLGLHAPSELIVTSLSSAAGARELEWLKWMPHASAPGSPLRGVHLADTPVSNVMVLTQLEQLADERLASGSGASGAARDLRPPLTSALLAGVAGAQVGAADDDAETLPPLPEVLCIITSDAPVDRGRVVQLVERAPGAGIIPLVIAETPEQLPAACRTFVDLRGGPGNAAVQYVRHGRTISPVVTESLTRTRALALAKGLSGVVDSGAASDLATEIPRAISLVTLLGLGFASAPGVIVDRWRQNLSLRGQARPGGRKRREPNLRALVGKSGVDSMHLDLRGQGPHALVAGTTGSGKSEFLKSWVLGMATEFSPDRVTFLFVDYKGGSAFAECTRLPHSVGVVTDLTPHLVRRALTSLGAEVKSREKLVNAKKAKDILELEEKADPDCPPALIIVIDEFAALAREVPDFVDGVIDIAQRGRSLGIHLIMATQRPAGVITPALRANTNLRVALRMADESESADVVDVPDAARFDPSIKGRALAKTGPGRLVQFQSAYVGGWTAEVEPRPTTVISELRFGATSQWEKPEDDTEPVDPGPTDEFRMVATIVAAAEVSGINPPKRPWLDELDRTYDLLTLLRRGSRSDTALVFGWTDIPELQAQQPAVFSPDIDGHLLVYGTGGSGKSVLLRSVAAAAGVTPMGGPVQVYGLDFASGGLRMIEVLPHVGSVVAADDNERVIRLLRTLKSELDRRSREYSRVRADSIVSYRAVTGLKDEPRIILLLDGFPAFRTEYENATGRSAWYAVFQQLLTEGRQRGIHVVMTADRPASVPGAIASNIPRRVVLRQSDDSTYSVLGVPSDILGPESSPGRAIVDQSETQVAVLGGKPSAVAQAEAMETMAAALSGGSVVAAPAIPSLPTKILLSDLQVSVHGEPSLGISDETLEAIGFKPQGTFVVAGGPSSGRSNALAVLFTSMQRSQPQTRCVYLSARTSPLAGLAGWAGAAVGVDKVVAAAGQLAAELDAGGGGPRVAVFIEGLSDLLGTAADAPLVALIKTIRRTDHFVVAESETSTWSTSYPLFGELKAGRTGILLQPEPMEGELILKAALPRVSRAEFPPGRGYLVRAGRALGVQLPLATPGPAPDANTSAAPSTHLPELLLGGAGSDRPSPN